MNRVSKEQIAAIRERFTDNHPGDVTFGHEDIGVLLGHIENQDALIRGYQEDLRDAGRELREVERERATLAQSVEDRGWGW